MKKYDWISAVIVIIFKDKFIYLRVRLKERNPIHWSALLIQAKAKAGFVWSQEAGTETRVPTCRKANYFSQHQLLLACMHISRQLESGTELGLKPRQIMEAGMKWSQDVCVFYNSHLGKPFELFKSLCI